MAYVELDSFVSKLKSLWQSGISATLNVEVVGGKASIMMKADIGYLPPPLHDQTRHGSQLHRGPAYRRRQARRRQAFAADICNTVESQRDAEVADNQTDGIVDTQEEVTEAESTNIDVVESGQTISDVENELRAMINNLQNELQDKNEVIAVNNMLHEDFKETVKNKYFYSSNDEISDYEPDDILREISRQEFMRRKLDKRSALVQKKDIACQKCDFIAKSEPGLKTHIKKKH